jgi:hypothetical protein
MLVLFIQFIKSNYLIFFSEQYIKIFVQIKTKQNLEEAYIYIYYIKPLSCLITFYTYLTMFLIFKISFFKFNYSIFTNILLSQICELFLNQAFNLISTPFSSSLQLKYFSISFKIASLNINSLC